MSAFQRDFFNISTPRSGLIQGDSEWRPRTDSEARPGTQHDPLGWYAFG
jgi:hypothetical protein